MPDRHSPRPYRSLAIAATAGLLALVVGAGAVSAAATTTRVSISTQGVEGNDDANYPAVSANGRFVAFMSESDKMVPADKNNEWDVFVRDRSTGKTEWISRSLPGTQNDDLSTDPAISANGRFVVFESSSSKLVSNDTNGKRDVFLRDRATGKTRRISRGFNGAESDGHSSDPAISADGRYVAFESDATNLVKNGTNAWRHVYRYDREKRIMRLVTVGPNGVEGGGSDPSVSANGRLVAFESTATNLVAGDTNGNRHVFVRNMATKVTRQVLGKAGVEGDGNSDRPAISGDGRWVAFESYATNLLGVGNDTNGDYDVFLSDLDTGRIRRVSRGLESAQPVGQSILASVSSNGRWVAFASSAANLVKNDTNNDLDVFIYDRKTRGIRRVSIRTNKSQSDSGSGSSAISADGRWVAFNSWGPLVAADTNDDDDIYVRGPLH